LTRSARPFISKPFSAAVAVRVAASAAAVAAATVVVAAAAVSVAGNRPGRFGA
jgi:hypothetical protein